eukprot:TRINITY_DN24_c0_g1_i7.p1 TRINITY_DN24_c0_g1~~TRINITY_DN24_c0_g1_i7.p1  ORF type:complete len:324 (+),score=100.77 TRINITY_DN24_c0_g1_i7:58-972(+)
MLAWTLTVAAVAAEITIESDTCDGSVCLGSLFTDGVCSRGGILSDACYIPSCAGQLPNTQGVRPCAVYKTKVTMTGPTAAASGQSLPSTTPTSSLKSERIVDNMKGWLDIPESTFFNYPSSLIGRRAMVPSAYIKPYWTVEFDCPKGYSGEGKMCDAFVFLYRCPPCTYQDGGNLAVDLLANGWTPYSCSVEFMLDKTVPTYHHKTMVYHKQVAEGAYEDVMPTALLELAWFASSPATSHCASYLNENDCENQLPGECEWDDTHGTCDRVLCPLPVKPHPQGPWQPKCTVCIDDERAQYMPALK